MYTCFVWGSSQDNETYQKLYCIPRKIQAHPKENTSTTLKMDSAAFKIKDKTLMTRGNTGFRHVLPIT